MRPWIFYTTTLAVCCMVCPPLVAFSCGIGMFCVAWYVLYRILSG